MEYIIGRKYHCSWAKNKGYVWRLISFDESKNEAVLETPKTKKRLTTQLSALYNINKNEEEIKPHSYYKK
jgi:hypothetical protein